MSGSKFARKELLKCGWTEGKGLGRDESGMKESIKVHMKNNRTGIGVDLGKEFTNHWWDDVFNKAANSIQVETTLEGSVTLKKQQGKESVLIEKKRKKMALYGNFVKGATLKHEEGRHVEEKEGSSSSESEEEESRVKLSETELFQLCGGRTAHKGARHGMQLSGKLQRIEAMEMGTLPLLQNTANERTNENELAKKKKKRELRLADEEELGDLPKKKKKKKKQTHSCEENSGMSNHENANDCPLDGNESDSQTVHSGSKKKKKKRTGVLLETVVSTGETGSPVDEASDQQDVLTGQSTSGVDEHKSKSKKKKRTGVLLETGVSIRETGSPVHEASNQQDFLTGQSLSGVDEHNSKSKKKKKKKKAKKKERELHKL